MVWNMGGSQGQHDVGSSHTFLNKAAHLCACPKHLFMNVFITGNKEVKLEILVHSEIYNLTEYIGRCGFFGRGRPGRQDGNFQEAFDYVEFCSGRSNKIAGSRQDKTWKPTGEKHFPRTFPYNFPY